MGQAAQPYGHLLAECDDMKLCLSHSSLHLQRCHTDIHLHVGLVPAIGQAWTVYGMACDITLGLSFVGEQVDLTATGMSGHYEPGTDVLLRLEYVTPRQTRVCHLKNSTTIKDDIALCVFAYAHQLHLWARKARLHL